MVVSPRSDRWQTFEAIEAKRKNRGSDEYEIATCSDAQRRTDLGRGAGRRFNQKVMMIPDRHMDVETSRHAVYVSSMIYLDSGHIPGSRRPLFAIIKFFLVWPVRATIRLGPMGRDSTPNDRPAKTAQSYQSLARVMTRNDNEQAFFFQASPTRNSGSGRLRSGGF